MQTTFWKCNATDCAAIHDPGEPLGGTGGAGSIGIEAVSAMNLQPGMLPGAIIDSGPASGVMSSYRLVE